MNEVDVDRLRWEFDTAIATARRAIAHYWLRYVSVVARRPLGEPRSSAPEVTLALGGSLGCAATVCHPEP